MKHACFPEIGEAAAELHARRRGIQGLEVLPGGEVKVCRHQTSQPMTAWHVTTVRHLTPIQDLETSGLLKSEESALHTSLGMTERRTHLLAAAAAQAGVQRLTAEVLSRCQAAVGLAALAKEAAARVVSLQRSQ